MEARATFNGAGISRTFMASALVLVAMGLSAMGGYVAGGALNGNHSAGAVTRDVTVHPAAGSVLRQDNPQQAGAEIPGWLQSEIGPTSANRTQIVVDDPNFYNQYLTKPVSERPTGHRELP